MPYHGLENLGTCRKYQIMDQKTWIRVGIPEYVDSRTSGPPPGQNTDKAHTHSPRLEIENPDLAGNRTRAAWFEASNSIDGTKHGHFQLQAMFIDLATL